LFDKTSALVFFEPRRGCALLLVLGSDHEHQIERTRLAPNILSLTAAILASASTTVHPVSWLKTLDCYNTIITAVSYY